MEEVLIEDERVKKENDEKDCFKVKKKKKPKKGFYILILLVLIITCFITYKIVDKKIEEKRMEEARKEKLEQERIKLEEIKSHYNDIVITNKDAKLYKLENDEFKEFGTIYSDITINLDEIEEITFDTEFFKIKDRDYYIKYEDVSKTDKEMEKDSRYKNYLVFNQSVVTKDNFTLYLDDKKMYTFTSSMTFPIIVLNFENKHYVEYDNMLLSISKDEVKEVIKANNTTKKNQPSITTLAYHRVYDTGDVCTDDYVCIKKANFDMEMKYLKDNNYLTLTMDEMYKYLKGHIQVEKGVCITIDDGLLTKSMIEVLEKYNLYGTLFVVTSITSNYQEYASPNLFLQSHTDNLHRNWVCPGGNQGGAILCASYNEIKKDLETSINKLGTKPIALAYPFYDYNQNAINVLKDVGFKMAFVGRAWTEGKATPYVTDMYKIPRMTVWELNIMDFNTWKSYL